MTRVTKGLPRERYTGQQYHILISPAGIQRRTRPTRPSIGDTIAFSGCKRTQITPGGYERGQARFHSYRRLPTRKFLAIRSPRVPKGHARLSIS